MKYEIAKLIVEAAEQAGLDGVTLYDGYSGRGMFGKTTTGIVTEQHTSIFEVLGAVISLALYEPELFGEIDPCEFGECARSDNMGLGMIYY